MCEWLGNCHVITTQCLQTLCERILWIPNRGTQITSFSLNSISEYLRTVFHPINCLSLLGSSTTSYVRERRPMRGSSCRPGKRKLRRRCSFSQFQSWPVVCCWNVTSPTASFVFFKALSSADKSLTTSALIGFTFFRTGSENGLESGYYIDNPKQYDVASSAVHWAFPLVFFFIILLLLLIKRQSRSLYQSDYGQQWVTKWSCLVVGGLGHATILLVWLPTVIQRA